MRKLKKLWVLLPTLALVLTCTPSFAAGIQAETPASANNDLAPGPDLFPASIDGDAPYTAVVRYYDDVQITYELDYPTGGIWNGAADIPIGEMGEVADQVYCVDPYVPFHSLADESYWEAGATVDKMGEYTVAAPWVVSPAMQGEKGDAVRWIVLNGYRGDYLLQDGVSSESVQRLQTVFQTYPGVGVVDAKIALMATKVAIWKTLVGDSLTILKTSLDGDPVKRNTFDALVKGLCEFAETQFDTGLRSTEFALQINEDSFSPHTTEGDSTYIGPFTVSAALSNVAGGGSSIPNVEDGVNLLVSGPHIEGVSFVHEPAFGELFATAGELDKKDGVPYIGRDLSVSGSWESEAFYLKVPANRADNITDLLTVKARARAVAVPLMVGTPVTFIHGNNWNSAQALIGAAGYDGMELSLFAEDVYRTSGLGQLYVTKTVAEATPVDHQREFMFQVRYAATSGGAETVLNLSDFPVHGAYSVDLVANTFVLKDGGMALIEGLPADAYYTVEETYSSEYDPAYAIPVAEAAVPALQSGAKTNPFRVDAQPTGGVALVEFTNTRNNTTKAHLYLDKATYRLPPGGDASAWELVTWGSFSFTLEYSSDGGQTWNPAALTDAMFLGDEGQIMDQSQHPGMFTLNARGVVMLEIDPTLGDYRVTETASGSGYAAMYSLLHYTKGGGGWTSTAETANDNSTSSISLAPNDQCYVMFTNMNMEFQNLSVSKTVEGGTAVDTERLFSFKLVVQSSLNSVFLDVPLSQSATADKVFVEGLPSGRIKADESGNPVIFELKHGETARIRDLPPGNYKVIELNGAGYQTTYTVNAGPKTSALAGGETEDIQLSEDTAVAFINTGEAPSTNGSIAPRVGDANNVLAWLLVLSASALVLLGTLVWRKRRQKGNAEDR